jgi:hypothetical protein
MSNRKPGPAPAYAGRPPVVDRKTTPAPSAERSRPADEAAGTPEFPVAPALLVVSAGDPPEHLFRRLLSAYLGGARAFRVVETPRLSPGTRDVVREFCRRTRQPEVVREGKEVLDLEELDDCEPGLLDERLFRLGAMVTRLHREAVESWAHLSFADDGLWSSKDDDVDREAWYLERSIALGERGGRGLSRPATGAWTIARSLERIADHAVTLGEVGPRLTDLVPGESPLRELRQFHAQAMAHLEAVLASPDGSEANDLLDVGEALLAGGRALAERLLPAVGDGSMSPASAAAVARALEAIGRTVAYSQDIAQAFFDRSSPSAPSTAPGASAGLLAVTSG